MRAASVLIIGFLISLLANAGRCEDAGSRRPNVLFLICDDLNCDLACYGRTDIRTPHLDQLAKSGVRFTSHYARSP